MCDIGSQDRRCYVRASVELPCIRRGSSFFLIVQDHVLDNNLYSVLSTVGDILIHISPSVPVIDS